MSAFKNWRMRCGMLLLVILAGCNGKSGLDGDTTAPEVPPPNTANGIATRMLDATKTDQWVYFNLASNAVVYPADPDNSEEWDIAFQRFKIKANSGVSGSGDVQVALQKKTDFVSVEALPAGLQYYRDRALGELSDAELIALDAGQFFAVCATGFTCIDAAAGTVDRAHLNIDIAAYAMLTLGGGMMYGNGPDRPILGWYDYFFQDNHLLKPALDTWFIRSIDGYDFKLSMIGYYGIDAKSESGNMAFKYQSLTPGFSVPEAGAAQFKISLDASSLQGTAPLNVDFSTQSAGGTPAQWQWDFGDGATSTAMAPSHVYRQAGTYIATVTVTDQRGARNSQSVTIAVSPVGNQPPVANAGPDQTIQLDSGVTQTQVTLDASGSSDADGTISYAWSGSPKPNDEIAPVVTLGIGSYEFTLTVTDDRGATAIDKVLVIVASPDNTPPTATINATPLSGGAPLVVQFDGSASSDGDGAIVSYQWSFGDGNTASTVSPQHTYTQPGHYTATLTVTDDGGAIATASRSIDATLVVAPSADTYVYEFLGNQTPSESLFVWNHESNHGARILMDFDGLDAQLAALAPGNFTATLRLYIICDLTAGIGLVQSCPGYADAGSPGGIATVTTDIRSQQAAWTENGVIAWSGVQEGTQYATFTANVTDQWIDVDVTTLVEAWRAGGSTGNGIVLTQEAYPVVRDDASFIAVLGLRSKESPVAAERPYLEIRINQ